MTESQAIVTRVEGDFAFIEVKDDVSSCGSCGDKGQCGKAQAGPRRYAVRNRIGAVPGDLVVVAVPAGAVLHAAALSYLMPLLFVLAGAAVGTVFIGDGLPAVVGAVLGLLAGVFVLRLTAGRAGCHREPALSLEFKGPINPLHKEA